jgi:geranylgeranyl reductase family protein
MPQVKTDVAVVGAGPAGSVAAHRLATAGVQVALLERAHFPRDKACGDGVSAQGLAALARTGLGDWATQFAAPEMLRLTSPDSQVLDVRPKSVNGHCYGRTIPRRLLDARLAQAAMEAGAHLLEGTSVRGVERVNGRSVRITTNDLTLEAQMVILADGSNAPITRRMGLVQEQPELVAIRQYFAGDTGPTERMEIHFEAWIMPGYTWVFPTDDGHANVGTGTFTRRVRQDGVKLKNILKRFVTDLSATAGSRLSQAEPTGPARGHPLRTQFGDTRTHAERILVVGDAAGLVSPLTGEGIGPAMESGEMAAAHTIRALETGNFSAQALSRYSHDLETRYGAHQRAARTVRSVLHTPRLLNRIFGKLRQDEALALLITHILLSHESPCLALRPRTLLRLLI